MNNPEDATPQLAAPPCSAAYLAEDVSVAMLARWINDAHLEAAREKPPNMDYMRAMQRHGDAVQNALDSYRMATQPPNDIAQQRATNNEPSRGDAKGALAAAPSDDDGIAGFCIVDPDGNRQEDTFGRTEDDAWHAFCYPSLRRKGYEGEGWRSQPCRARAMKANA